MLGQSQGTSDPKQVISDREAGRLGGSRVKGLGIETEKRGVGGGVVNGAGLGSALREGPHDSGGCPGDNVHPLLTSLHFQSWRRMRPSSRAQVNR